MTGIPIYSPNETDFSTNGLGLLLPIECAVEEAAAGMWEATLVHPITDDLRWSRINAGCLLKIDVPLREAPVFEYGGSETGGETREIYKVDTPQGGRLRLRRRASLNAKILSMHREGTEVIRLGVSGDWAQVVICNGGATGYMWADYLAYVRTDTVSTSQNSTGGSVQLELSRDQLFRIYSVEKDTDACTVTVKAMHIFYDQRGNLINDDYSPENANAAEVVSNIQSKLLYESEFTLHGEYLGGKVTADYGYMNPVEALLDPDTGIAKQTGAMVIRDNYDTYLIPDSARDTGVTIRRGKNLVGVNVTYDDSAVVTRIIPCGRDEDGEPLYLSGTKYVDSPHINDYPTIFAKRIEYNVVSGSDEFPDDEAARAELVRLAELEFSENAIDLPSYGMEVDFVLLANTREYANYAALQAVHMYDTVTVIDELIGVEAKVRVTRSKWNRMTKQFDGVTLGEIQALNQMVYSYNLPDGGVSGNKITPGSASGAILRNLSVQYAKISNAAIDQLAANSIQAVTAYIGELVAGNITADQLYANLATIAQAQITAANIENADIDWASINNLTANIASVANAQIGTANIGYGQITDLVTNTAIITEGEAGQLYIARLNVTEANMVQLSVGSLMLQAEDGSFVQLVADGSGGVTTQPVQVEGGNIAEGTVSGSNLIQNTITARELNVEKIFADEALIRAIRAANIDVADLFAAQATIEQLESWVVSANTIQALENALDLWASDKITLAIRNSEAAGVVNSSVTITENAVDIATPTFHVHNSETGMIFDENGLTAESVEAPNVAKRYDGPSAVYVDPAATSDQIAAGYYYRSLADVIAILSNRWIGRNVTVNLAAGMVEYGALELRGTTGSGQISIAGSASSPAKLVGSMRVYACSNTVEISCLNVDAADDAVAYRISGASTYVHVQNAVVNGGSRGVQAEYGAAAYIQNCEFYDGAYSVCAWMMGQACSENNKGNTNLYATRARIYANGTQPCAETGFTYSAFAGDVIAQSVTVDQGSSSSAEAQPATASYAAANTDSYGDGWSRFDDNDVRQGYTENAGEIRGCMWFDNEAIRAALSGKTVRQASLSLHQLKGYGRGVGVNVYLKGTAMDYAGRSGSPAIAADYGLIGATEPGETTEITIPVQAVNDLVSGTINGLMLIADDGEAYKDRTYSKNYARFSGETTGSNLPVIKITYT